MNTENEGWGVYDPVDQCWMGNGDGPFRYRDCEHEGTAYIGRDLAVFAADVMGRRMGFPGRFEAALLPPDPLHYKDEVTPPHSVERAMRDYLSTPPESDER